MKALVLTAYHHLEIQDVPEPEPGPDEVVVHVRACGICGSDVHGLDGSTGRRRPPIIMGHEASGVVARMGSGVTGWSVGDRVTFDSTVYCGTCWFCMRGQVNLCDHRRVLGVSCEEYRQHGAMAEYVAVPQRIVYRIPEAVTFAQAAMVEPLSVALHGVERLPIQLADTAVVVGSGMIGLLALQMLRAAGCSRVYAVDLDPRRLALAVRLGAQEGLQPDQVDVPAQIARRTDGRGADVVVEAAGTPRTVPLAVACLRKGGYLALIGNLAPDVPLPLQAVVTRELTLRGSCASQADYARCLALVAAGVVQLDPLISAIAPLDQGPEWFARLYRGTEGLLKVILEP